MLLIQVYDATGGGKLSSFMKPIQEVFQESDWEELEQAQQARENRVAYWQAQGYLCSCETLYNAITGRRILLLEVSLPDAVEPEAPVTAKSSTKTAPVRRPKRTADRLPRTEIR